MENYKIKVNSEAESKEAQELFEQLGFTWAGDYPENGDWYSHLYAENSTCCYLSPYVWGGLADRFKELTLQQLRDLVVLYRNDVKDATHVGRSGSEYYVNENDAVFFFDGFEWVEKQVDVNNLEPIHKKAEQGLISGAEAKLAWAKGEDLQIDTGVGFEDLTGNYYLAVFERETNKFRRKPRTLTLSLEIPAPFEPKEGDEYFLLNPFRESGYDTYIFDSSCDHIYVQFGAWDSEEKVKAVVAALRGIKG